MTKPKRMTEDELIALSDLEVRNAVGYFGGRLAEQRRRATYYYLAEAEGDLAPPEVEGRSSVVVPFVRNTLEAMLPQAMERFTGSDKAVEFEPQNAGPDEQRADHATDYLNYLFFKKNKGFTVTETWFRDALLYKNGIIKVWWDTRVEETKEEYKALSQVELAEIMDDPEVEVTESNPYPDEEDAKQRQQAVEQLTQQLQQAMQAAQTPGPQQQQAMQAVQGMQQHLQAIQSAPPVLCYDITAKRSKKGGKLSIENVPPEEFLISRKAKSIATASFVGHRTGRTISELRSMGYENLDDINGDEGSETLNAERIERESYDDEYASQNGDPNVTDESQRRVWVVEAYIRCDWDGDGIAELRKITKVGNRLLDNEEVDIAPFVDIVCVRKPHTFFGLSLYDLGADTQKTQTSLLRSRLDNEYLETNGRYFAVENQVNLDDLLSSRPGGVVRIKAPGMVGRLDQGSGNSAASMELMQYMEQFGEAAVGWTRNSQGNAAGPLLQGTATGANIVANKDDMRLDLICRNFAEGFTELFRQMLKLVCQHQDKKVQIRLSGEWVDIDPREWKNQFDVSINVGLGAGSKDQKIQQTMAIIAQQEKVFPLGVANPENIYNASVELTKLAGHKNGDKFFTDPAKAPPQPPKPDPEMVKGQVATQIAQANGQVTMQVENAKLQAQMQMAQHKAELDAQVAQAQQVAQGQQETQQQQIQAQLDTHKANLEAQVEQQRMAHEMQMHQMRLDSENARAQLDRDAKILIAQIAAQTATDNAALAAQAKADSTLAGA